MTKDKLEAWALAVFVGVMLVYVLPELPLIFGIIGLVGIVILAIR